METIEFSIAPAQAPAVTPTINITINGQNLIDLVRAVEHPFANAERSPGIAGAYSGLPATPDTLPPSRHFFGQPSYGVYVYGAKTQVLECECGEPGCWPLICEIQVTDQTVTWQDFEQPHRSAHKPNHWPYTNLGPFTFSRSDYEQSLMSLTSGPESATPE